MNPRAQITFTSQIVSVTFMLAFSEAENGNVIFQFCVLNINYERKILIKFEGCN